MIQRISESNTTVLIPTTPPVVQYSPVSEFQNILEEQYSESNTGHNDINSPESLESIFQKAADTYHISLNLLKAVAKAESDFDANCTSSSGAMGIMQLMPETAKELGVTNAYDPEENIMAGAKYLAENLSIYNNDISLSLAAYNAGRGAVKKYDGIPPYTETQNYVKKILGYLEDANIQIPNVSINNISHENTNSDANTYSNKDNLINTLDLREKKALEQLSHSGNTLLMTRLYAETK